MPSSMKPNHTAGQPQSHLICLLQCIDRKNIIPAAALRGQSLGHCSTRRIGGARRAVIEPSCPDRAILATTASFLRRRRVELSVCTDSIQGQARRGADELCAACNVAAELPHQCVHQTGLRASNFPFQAGCIPSAAHSSMQCSERQSSNDGVQGSSRRPVQYARQ